MVLLTRWCPIVNLFVCNYITELGERKCARQHGLDSCLCAVRERLKEWSIKLPHSLSFIGYATCFSHRFWAHWRRYHSGFHSWNLGETRFSRARCRFDYHKAALLNYPFNGQVDSVHLHKLGVNGIRFCASAIEFWPCCVCRLYFSLHLQETAREKPSYSGIFLTSVLKRQISCHARPEINSFIFALNYIF